MVSRCAALRDASCHRVDLVNNLVFLGHSLLIRTLAKPLQRIPFDTAWMDESSSAHTYSAPQ